MINVLDVEAAPLEKGIRVNWVVEDVGYGAFDLIDGDPIQIYNESMGLSFVLGVLQEWYKRGKPFRP